MEYLRGLQETLRVSGIDNLGTDIPPRMVDISSISAYVDFLNSGCNNVLVAHSSPNLFQNLMVLLVLWVADNSNTLIPLGLFGAENVSIDSLLHFFDDFVNFSINMLVRRSFIVFLLLWVVQLTVSD